MEPRPIILGKLEDIEHEHGVTILLAVESGSRMWGFESPNSDYDVRFVYVRPMSWYMSIRERRDVIERPHKLWDLSGWDLRKALYQMQRGNVALFEWLKSPIVYSSSPEFADQARALMPKFFNSRTAIYHYLHTVCGNYNRKGASSTSGDGLATAVARYPTPCASTYGTNQGGGMGRVGKARPGLETMARHNLWPTPVASANANRTTKPRPSETDGRGHGATLSGEVGGNLNPTWVEWLMGYAADWTVCAPWVTPLFHPKRAKHLFGSQDSGMPTKKRRSAKASKA